MAGYCPKTCRNFSKKWIPLAAFRGIPGRRPLRQPNANLYHYAGNNPVRYIDPTGKFSIKFDNDNDLLAFSKSFTMMMAVPLGGGLDEDQETIRKIVNIGNTALGFIPNLGDFNCLSFSSDSDEVVKNTGKSLIGPSLESLKTIAPKMESALGAVGTVLNVIDFAMALFSTPEMNPNDYTQDAQSLLVMIGIEQTFAKDFCKELKKRGITYTVNYTNSFISNISIMGDWEDPTSQLKQVFDAVKASKPELYKDVQLEN